jgi:hypothetical protein
MHFISELKHKSVGITYSTKRLEYYKQYVCVKVPVAAPVLFIIICLRINVRMCCRYFYIYVMSQLFILD